VPHIDLSVSIDSPSDRPFAEIWAILQNSDSLGFDCDARQLNYTTGNWKNCRSAWEPVLTCVYKFLMWVTRQPQIGRFRRHMTRCVEMEHIEILAFNSQLYFDRWTSRNLKFTDDQRLIFLALILITYICCPQSFECAPRGTEKKQDWHFTSSRHIHITQLQHSTWPLLPGHVACQGVA